MSYTSRTERSGSLYKHGAQARASSILCLLILLLVSAGTAFAPPKGYPPANDSNSPACTVDPASANAAQSSGVSCPPCGPLYCKNKAAADQEREKKQARMRAEGFPERLVNLLNQYQCVACIRYAPDSFTIQIEYAPGKGPSSGGQNWTSVSYRWTAQEEALARKELREGKIKAFYIMNSRTKCKCCDDPDPQTLPDYDPGLEMNTGGVLSYTTPQSLGPDPPELGQVPPEMLQELPPMGTYTKPPMRQAHATCPACNAAAEKYNGIASTLDYLWSQKINLQKGMDITHRAMVERDNQIAALEYQQSLNPNPATQNQIDALEKVNAAQADGLQYDQRKLDNLDKQIAQENALLKSAEAALLQCEQTQCKPPAAVTPPTTPAIPSPAPKPTCPPGEVCGGPPGGACTGPACTGNTCTGSACSGGTTSTCNPATDKSCTTTPVGGICQGGGACTSPPSTCGPGSGQACTPSSPAGGQTTPTSPTAPLFPGSTGVRYPPIAPPRTPPVARLPFPKCAKCGTEYDAYLKALDRVNQLQSNYDEMQQEYQALRGSLGFGTPSGPVPGAQAAVAESEQKLEAQAALLVQANVDLQAAIKAMEDCPAKKCPPGESSTTPPPPTNVIPGGSSGGGGPTPGLTYCPLCPNEWNAYQTAQALVDSYQKEYDDVSDERHHYIPAIINSAYSLLAGAKASRDAALAAYKDCAEKKCNQGTGLTTPPPPTYATPGGTPGGGGGGVTLDPCPPLPYPISSVCPKCAKEKADYDQARAAAEKALKKCIGQTQEVESILRVVNADGSGAAAARLAQSQAALRQAHQDYANATADLLRAGAELARCEANRCAPPGSGDGPYAVTYTAMPVDGNQQLILGNPSAPSGGTSGGTSSSTPGAGTSSAPNSGGLQLTPAPYAPELTPPNTGQGQTGGGAQQGGGNSGTGGTIPVYQPKTGKPCPCAGCEKEWDELQGILDAMGNAPRESPAYFQYQAELPIEQGRYDRCAKRCESGTPATGTGINVMGGGISVTPTSGTSIPSGSGLLTSTGLFPLTGLVQTGNLLYGTTPLEPLEQNITISNQIRFPVSGGPPPPPPPPEVDEDAWRSLTGPVDFTADHTPAGPLQFIAWHPGESKFAWARFVRADEEESGEQAQTGIIYSIVANGKSSGEAMELQAIDPSGKLQQVELPEGTILEPLKRGTANPVPPQAPPGGKRFTMQLTAYCVDRAKLPPQPGQLYRLAPPAVQAKYPGVSSVLRAGREMAARGALHPDSDAKEYADSIQQYSVWAKLENWDQQKFTEMFLEHTKKNAQAMNVTWTQQMDQAVRTLAPGRWQDVSQVLETARKYPDTAAGRGTP